MSDQYAVDTIKQHGYKFITYSYIRQNRVLSRRGLRVCSSKTRHELKTKFINHFVQKLNKQLQCTYNNNKKRFEK